MARILPVILAGGVGSRLWPASRALYPKQFLPLADKQYSLLQQTILRLPLDSDDVLPPLFLCQFEHRFLLADQLEALDLLDKSTIILESEGKNTAPAVILAALHAKAAYPKEDVHLLIMPADHFIEDVSYFQKHIMRAKQASKAAKLVTFGIKPTTPETGYGYIEQGEALPGLGANEVKRFIEKPDQATAEHLIKDGRHFWNSGIFMFLATTILGEAERLMPEQLAMIQQCYAQKCKNLMFWSLPAELFSAVHAISLDYAIMEKSHQVVVMPFEAPWSDLGSWEALANAKTADAAGNFAVGDVMTEDCENCALFSQDRLLAAVGVKNAVIVETADAVLVADKNHAQSVKQLVEALRTRDRQEFKHHRQVFRPWGSYETLQKTAGFCVKRLIVKPGQAISLQSHEHRSEHWVVVSGVADIQCDGEDFTLKANESTYIPKQAMHRLSNKGDELVEIIEVQVGDYLEEDDIKRYTDDYGRIPDRPEK